MKQFVKVPTEDVINIWSCGTEGCGRIEDTIRVSPEEYAMYGIPECSGCGHNLVFSHVEVALENNE